MKVAIITDVHWGARGDSPLFIDYYKKFYDNVFFPYLQKHEIKTVLMLGDTFDRRKYVNFVTLKKAKEIYFDRLSSDGIKTYILVGNHDTSFKNTNEVNSVDLLLSEYHNIEVIDKPKTLHFHTRSVCMIPWICADNYDECLEEIKNTSADVCCGHFEISGFAMYRGMPCEEGLDRGLFRKFYHTFSGHYHHKSSADDIFYLGNPYELTWQDYGDDRGFHIFDMDSSDLTFIKNPFKMFYKLKYDDKEESITEVTNKDLTSYTNTYVKVVVVNKTNPYLFDRFMEKLYAVNPADVTIVEDFTDLTEGVDDDILDQAEDTLTILNKYVDGITDDISTDKLKSLMRELYVEALNTEQT